MYQTFLLVVYIVISSIGIAQLVKYREEARPRRWAAVLTILGLIFGEFFCDIICEILTMLLIVIAVVFVILLICRALFPKAFR